MPRFRRAVAPGGVILGRPRTTVKPRPPGASATETAVARRLGRTNRAGPALPHRGRVVERARMRVRKSASLRNSEVQNEVTARILDGKAIAEQIRAELGARVERVRERLGRPPALAIVLVGDDPASQVYVKSKLATAE